MHHDVVRSSIGSGSFALTAAACLRRSLASLGGEEEGRAARHIHVYIYLNFIVKSNTFVFNNEHADRFEKEMNSNKKHIA